MKQKIFVALSTFAEYGNQPLKLLEASGIPFTLNPLGRRLRPADIIELAADATSIVAGVEPYAESVLKMLPFVRCISRCGVGMDAIDHAYAKEHGIVICNTPDVVIQPVAELTLAMMFDLMRHLSYHTSVVRSRQWKKRAGHLLTEQCVGILGLGRIGKRVAEMLCSLGVEVLGSDQCPDLVWAEQAGVKMVGIDELLQGSDIVSLHLSPPLDGRVVLDQAFFESMKNGSVLVNTARGNLVDEAALIKALNSGSLSGAALDVFSQEPYSGPLCGFDNVVMTPHVATLTKESRVKMETEAVENVLAALHE